LFAGYSVGELAAYGCAGALGVEGTLRLAMARAACMDDASAVAAGGLVAVRGLPRARIEALCTELGAVIAIINGPEHFVLGAPVGVLERIEPAARARGAALVRRLPVAVAAHTPWLKAAGAVFATALQQSALSDPPLPVLAGVSGEPVRHRAAAIATLSEQLSTPVDWAACMQAAWELGARVFLELGPGSALTRIARELLPQAAARALDDFHTLHGVCEWVGNALAER
jgi:[acyl-carrier-protein] S-malonyltransferase